MIETKKELARLLSASNIILVADFDDTKIAPSDTELLVSKLIDIKTGSEGVRLVSKEDIDNALSMLDAERLSKTPRPVETSKVASFVPAASETDAQYRIIAKKIETTDGSMGGFVDYFRNRLERLRSMLEVRLHSLQRELFSIESLKAYADGKEVAVIGIVNSRVITKNNNLMVLIEDETAEARLIFNSSGPLFETASRIVNDEVIAVCGKLSGQFIIAKEILWPDIPIKERKEIKDDVAIAFISDIHVGSKLFLERNFMKMLEWLNGSGDQRSKELAGKVKYIVIGGDVVDGIGVYPEQERDLSIPDIYRQYSVFSSLLQAIPEYIHTFVLPGNHDAVQLAEPQPAFPKELIEMDRSNVHFVTNPCYINLHGIEVLSYHGGGIVSIMDTIPNMSYDRPEEAMVEMLKRRHLSPIYGGNVIVPSRNDNLVIDIVPDIFQTGHVHKNGITEYHGVKAVNSGTWQGVTQYQIKRGLVPTPCNLPVFEARKYGFTTVDFSG